MNKDQIINTLKIVTLALVLSVGIQYAAAQTVTTWSPPSTTPPSGNTYAPLNVGISGQTKDGGLILGYGLNPSDNGLVVYKGKLNVGLGNTTGNTDATIQAVSPSAARFFLTNGTGSGQTWHMQAWNNAFSLTQSGVADRVSITPGTAADPNTSTITLNGKVKITGGTPTVGKVLTATDSVGNATWQTPAVSGGLPTGTAGQTLRYAAGTGWVANDIITNDGTNVTINGGANNAIKLTGGSPGNGKILTSNATGVATWKSTDAVSDTGGGSQPATACGLIAGKKYLALYSMRDVPSNGVATDITINGVTRRVRDPGSPAITFLTVPFTVTADANGCINVEQSASGNGSHYLDIAY